MPVIFEALDAEFAVATGAHANHTVGGPVGIRFDTPPDAASGLVIASLAGDPDPCSFEEGATYRLQWGGSVGGGEIGAAEVIGSDALPGGGHVVVFEGTDATGAPARVLWTPGLDLRGWLRRHCTPADNPAIHLLGIRPSGSFVAPSICFEADTLIETPRGPVRAASLVPGNLVETLDNGPQMVLWVGQSVVRGEGRSAPVEFPPGTLGNERPLVVSQHHRVLFRDRLAGDRFGEAEVLIPARMFARAGHAGARIRERPVIRYVHLLFERHEIVFANGVPCESLYLGDVARGALGGAARDEVVAHFPALDFSAGATEWFESVRPVLRPFEVLALFASDPAPMPVAV